MLALCAGLLCSPSPSQEDNGPVATGTLPHCVPPLKALLIRHPDTGTKRERERKTLWKEKKKSSKLSSLFSLLSPETAACSCSTVKMALPLPHSEESLPTHTHTPLPLHSLSLSLPHQHTHTLSAYSFVRSLNPSLLHPSIAGGLSTLPASLFLSLSPATLLTLSHSHIHTSSPPPPASILPFSPPFPPAQFLFSFCSNQSKVPPYLNYKHTRTQTHESRLRQWHKRRTFLRL